MADEEIETLNQITAMIDEKAAKYKNERHHMPRARAVSEKELILKLLEDGIRLAKNLRPPPHDLISDFQRLSKEFSRY
ncbi:MAG: hypothetical protein H7A21_13195 [Spirochaetales bacterium]|nr:hypothetical protein [Leptospiraceae bacterium]MCP5482384.1 hypothetical protein [Spirochaetales bacterium]MCP5484177.1 hypothetical protein [Spirochaetales bacterium]